MTSVPAAAATGSSCEARRSSEGAGSGSKSGIRSSRSRCSGGVRLGVDRLQLPPGERGEHREDRPGDDQRPANAHDVDEHGGERGAEADRPDEDHLEHAEDPADHVGRCGALEEREARDVDERVPEAEHGEREERDPQVRPDPDRGERRAEEDDPEPEVGREALAADQREGGERAEHAADAAGGVQQANRRVAAPRSSSAVTTTRTPSAAPARSVCAE